MLKDIIKFVRLISILQPLQAKFPRAYLMFASLVTAVGYGFIFFFPVASIVLFFTLFGAINNAATFIDWLIVLADITFLVLTSITSYFMFSTRFLAPKGVELDWEKSDRFIDEVLLLTERYSCRTFDQVIFSCDYSIKIIQTPRYSLPIFTHTTLSIGLPTLLCLSNDHFKGNLARVIGQYSGQYNKLSSWINFSTQIWHHYISTFKKEKTLFHKFILSFFSLYSPLTDAICYFAIQKDELLSDHYILDVINDKDVVAMISANIINPEFLDKKFWPKIQSIARKNPTDPEYLPYASMTNACLNGLALEDKERWLKQAYSASADYSETLPSLRERMYALGHEKNVVPTKFNISAAKFYLGDYANEVISTMDQIWLQRLQLALNVIKAHNQVHQDLACDDPAVMQLEKLKQKTKLESLNEDEVFELAKLTSKVEGKNAAIKIYNRILQQRPNDVKIYYSIGRSLLGNNDESGVKVLIRAMELNPKCQAPACRMISKYYLKTGDTKSAKKWKSKSIS